MWCAGLCRLRLCFVSILKCKENTLALFSTFSNDWACAKVKTLNAYSEEYDATEEVGKDYMFILEKFSKLYNFSKELDDILTLPLLYLTRLVVL